MKYQLTIIAESLQELQGVIDRLEQPVAAAHASIVVPTHATPAFAAPQPAVTIAVLPPSAPIVDDEEEEDDDAPLPNAPAPVVPVASPMPAGAVEELDPRGFPWDERIHSSSRARLAKGDFWKNRKNLPDGLIDQVEAELRAKGYGVPQTGVVPALPAIAPPPVAAPATPATNSGAVRVKELMTMGLAAGVWKAPELSKMIKAMGLEQLQDLMKYTGDFPSVIAAVELTSRLITLLTSGRVDQAWINQVLAYYTVADVYSLTGSLDKCAAIKEYLDVNGL